MSMKNTSQPSSLAKILERELAHLQIPTTGSPVPELTSLHTKPGRGPYGLANYPGNCSGLLIADLLRYYRPRSVLDPLCGEPHNGSCVAQPVMWSCPASSGTCVERRPLIAT